jgi:tyrosyl-tRNA synthetase
MKQLLHRHLPNFHVHQSLLPKRFQHGLILLTATGVVDSKSAARRIVKEGGAYLNNQKISGEDFRPSKTDFLCGKYAVLRKGKRDLAAVELI